MNKSKKRSRLPTIYILLLTLLFGFVVYYVYQNGGLENIITSYFQNAKGLIPIPEEVKGILVKAVFIDILIWPIIAVVASLVILEKKSIFTFWNLFITFTVPRGEKYWGIVIDRRTNAPLPFVQIELYIKDENEWVLNKVITDPKGRYKLRVYKEYESKKVFMRVQLEGYDSIIRRVNMSHLKISNGLITENIYLNKSGSRSFNPINIFRDSYSNIFDTFFFLVIYYPVLNLIFAFALIFLNTNPINLAVIAITTISTLWNTYIYFEKTEAHIGKIIDFETSAPLKSVQVTLTDVNGVRMRALSDSSGIVKFDIDGGFYKIDVFASNYTLKDTLGITLYQVEFTPDGYLKKDILMKQNTFIPLGATQMVNPFS